MTKSHFLVVLNAVFIKLAEILPVIHILFLVTNFLVIHEQRWAPGECNANETRAGVKQAFTPPHKVVSVAQRLTRLSASRTRWVRLFAFCSRE